MSDKVPWPTAGVRGQVEWFLALTVIFSTPWWILLAKHNGRWPLVLGLMCSPGAAGLITALLCRVPMRRFGWRWPKWKWIAAGYFIPIGYSLAAYGFIWTTGLGHPHEAYIPGPGQPTGWGLIWWVHTLNFIPFGFLPLILGLLGGATLGALGEEIGWRGFLVPAVASRRTFTRTSLLSGTIWALWHLPFLLFGGYHGSTPRWYSFLCFAAMIIPSGFLYTWVRLRSGSLWPCVMLHWAHNFWIQVVLTPRTGDTGPTRWWVDEFGAALAIVNILMGLYIWWRQKETLGEWLPAEASTVSD